MNGKKTKKCNSAKSECFYFFVLIICGPFALLIFKFTK
jgi:hypothetical protein